MSVLHPNFYHASGVLITLNFANSLDPDQDRENVSPDLDPNSLTQLLLKKKPANDNKSIENYPPSFILIYV